MEFDDAMELPDSELVMPDDGEVEAEADDRDGDDQGAGAERDEPL